MSRFDSVTKPLMWFMALLLVAVAAGCSSGGGGSSDGSLADTTAPTVSSTAPADAAIGIAINANITATFSEAMDPLTITTTTFTLIKQGTTTVVPGALSFPSTTTATLNPTNNLAVGTIYTATLTTRVKDLAGNALAVTKTWSFTTGVTADTTLPTVNTTVPADAATGIAVNANITATFSEAMDAATINTATFTLKQGTAAVSGAVSYAGTTATFNPSSDLAPSATYTATLTTGVNDLAGNALAVTKTWSFTTGATADIIVPTVTSTVPADVATGVALNANMTATFSEAMDAATITGTTFTLKQGTTDVSGAVSYVGTTATFNPSGNLLAGKLYTATIATGVKDLAGNAMAATKTWSFTTLADTTPPTVSSTIPADLATGVALNANITATFSEAMDAATITGTTFTLMQGITPVPGVVTAPSTTTATFNPSGDLTANTSYTATLTTGVKDLAGNALAAVKTWGFTTVAAGASGPLPVNLGLAGNFVILAKTGTSTTGTTAVTGDIGVSPIDSTGITGFGLIMDSTNTFATSSLVTGKIYAADYTEPTPTNLTTAIGDMQTAFTDAAGRTVPAPNTDLGAGNISGMTLAPGLYKWGTGVLITNAGVTLSGGANDVWIFQIAQDLTVDNGAIVTLGGSAQAKNIFWQVSGQATLGTTANFKGIILSQTLISLNTGAVLNGRALAQTAVTLDANAVTAP